MCGRFTLTNRDLGAIAAALDAELEAGAEALYRPRYNVAPTDLVFAARSVGGRRTLGPATWGLPGRRTPLVINARAESVAHGAFRTAFHERRCVVPADGFFEWTGPARARRPIWYHPAAPGALLFFAGIYQEGGERPAVAILTTAANDRVAPVHDRMPAILGAGEVGPWLAGPAPAVPGPAPPELLVATEVSRRVSSVANDDPECLAPPEPEPRRLL